MNASAIASIMSSFNSEYEKFFSILDEIEKEIFLKDSWVKDCSTLPNNKKISVSPVLGEAKEFRKCRRNRCSYSLQYRCFDCPRCPFRLGKFSDEVNEEFSAIIAEEYASYSSPVFVGVTC